jgi:metal-responsive CopG/Arc/MetJ family transcriptional regulator
MPKPKPTALLTISLPRKMAEQVEAAMKAEQRTRSELVREALRTYFARYDEEARLMARIARLPEVKPTARELRLLEQGRAEAARGETISLAEYARTLEHRPHQKRDKNARQARRA